jgi:hypothetical protein
MPVKVQGPDGQTYQFPDGTDKAAAVAYFKKKNITSAPNAEPPGFTSRLGEATGFPTSMEQLKAAQPSTAEKIGGPAVTAGKMALNYGKNLISEGRQAYRDIRQPGGNVSIPGTPVSLPIARFLTRGVLGPFGGTGVANLGEDIQGGNYSGAAGDALGTFINAMMLRKGSAPSAAKATNRLTFAAGKEAHLPIERTLPELREAASAGAKPETMDDFRSVTKAANSTVKREADAAMSSIALRQVLPTSIAQKIRDLIKPDMIKTTEGKAEIAHINAAAKVYEKPWTFAELDSKRMRLNADLSTFEKKTPIARYTAKAGNLNTAIDKVVADTIRDVIYPQMDQAAGRPPGYFRALKQKQGNLMQLDSQLAGRTKELKAQTAEVQGASRFNRENASIHMGGSGVPRASLYGLMNVIKKRNPLKSANKRVGMGFETGSPAAKAYTRTLPFRSTLFPQNEQEQR